MKAILTSALLLINFFINTPLTFSQCHIDDWTALKALYDSTNGDNWINRTGWHTIIDGQSSPPAGCDLSTLYGIELDVTGRIKEVRLNSNQLSGTIPTEIGTLINLENLWLIFNQLNGDIPSELGELFNLRELRLDENQLSGIIPPELGNLEHLLTLRLDDNQLTGGIPSELGNLSSLSFLRLDNNPLGGNIPPELGNLTYLNHLSLVGIQLNGVIPSELSDLFFLQYLGLNYNYLNGGIPNELGNLGLLTHLNLSNNDLTGSIPNELGNLGSLMQLDLSNNDLTGNLPSELGDLSNLQLLYLYSNNINGSIPLSLGNLTNLGWLNLRSNLFSGNIPLELGNLTNLQVMILFSNQLSGNMPQELGNLTNLAWLEINDNNLTGCYPNNVFSLCSQLTNPNFYGDVHISNGNNFEATWEDFCDQGIEACTNGSSNPSIAGCHIDDRISLKALIHNILKSKSARYNEVQQNFKTVKDMALAMLFQSFVGKGNTEMTNEHIELIDGFLVNLSKVTKSQNLESDIEDVRKYLYIMEGKEVKDALIAFDRAKEKETQESLTTSSLEETNFEVQLINSLGSESYIVYNLIRQGSLNMELYNSSGQKITTLFNGIGNQGNHQLVLNKSGLSQGVYFIHINCTIDSVLVHKILKLPVVQ